MCWSSVDRRCLILLDTMAAHPSPRQRYREGRVLGRGAFGVVRIARDAVSGEDVVVKRVALEGEDIEETREEVAIMKGLHHPHICRVVDAWEEAKALCIVMPFYSAGDLLQRIKSAEASHADRLPSDDVASYAAQLCLALQYTALRRLAARGGGRARSGTGDQRGGTH